MNIHEYQAKELLAKRGVPVPAGAVAYTAAEAVEAAKRLGGMTIWAVKAQIHAGGRGKAGGVKLARSEDEVAAAARALLGTALVTHQTGPEGRVVKRVYVEAGCRHRARAVSRAVDRSRHRAHHADRRRRGRHGDRGVGGARRRKRSCAWRSTRPPGCRRSMPAGSPLRSACRAAQVAAMVEFVGALYRAFIELDASLIEINPLVVTGVAATCWRSTPRSAFDDNALFRHPEIEALRDEDEEDPIEREAGKHQLNYVKLDGNIGCMVNGAGLAMATMDIIKLYGAHARPISSMSAAARRASGSPSRSS